MWFGLGESGVRVDQSGSEHGLVQPILIRKKEVNNFVLDFTRLLEFNQVAASNYFPLLRLAFALSNLNTQKTIGLNKAQNRRIKWL